MTYQPHQSEDTTLKTTITTGWADGHGLREGEMVSITEPDHRKWKRLWCWMTFRSPPQITRTYTIGAGLTATTFEMNKEG